MCGRFTLTVPTFEELADALGVAADPRLAAGYVPRFNVAPSQRAWVVARGVGGPELRLSRWGFDSRGPSSIVRLRRTRVGLRVNDVRNDDAACVEPGPEPPAAEGRTLDLFGEALDDVAPRKRQPRR